MNVQDQTPFPLALPLLLIHIKGTHTEEHPYSRSEMCVFVSQRHFEDDMLLSVLGFISSKCLLFADPAHRHKVLCCTPQKWRKQKPSLAILLLFVLWRRPQRSHARGPRLAALESILSGPCSQTLVVMSLSLCLCSPCCYGLGHSLQCYMEGRWSCVLEELWRGRPWREVRSEDGGVWGKCEGV